MRSTLVLLLGALTLSGCGASTSQLHVVAPIPRMATDITETTADGVTQTEPPPAGLWLTRSVYERSGKVVRLRAIEILYCPSKQSNYTECRLGMGWSSEKNPLVSP